MNHRFVKVAAGLSILFSTVVLVVGCTTKTEQPSYLNPFDPALGGNLPVPESVMVNVGDNVVHLTWRIPRGTSAEEYAIFRRTTNLDTENVERYIDKVSVREFRDTGVRNGRTYAYRIAAGAHGQFGRRTDEVEASPSLFGIVLADGAELTPSRDILVTFSAANAQGVRLAESPDSFPPTWRLANGQTQWTLSVGDGRKTVYGEFRLSDGSTSLPVSSTIRLDTKAVIRAVSFDGPTVRRPGDTIHVRVVTDEMGGSASVSVAGVFDSTPLFDDATGGDAVANDGVYERILTVPPAAAVHDARVVGSFADAAGTRADDVSASNLLSIESPPDPVSLLPASISEPPDPASVALRWSQSLDDAFARYRVFRADASPVDSTSRLLETIGDAAAVQFEDTDVVEGETYHYRIYTGDTDGLETGSNAVQAFVPNVRPPAAVTIESSSSASTTRIDLEWSMCPDRDFQSYRIYRNLTGAVSDADQLVAEIDNVQTLFWDDTGLQENTTYYYRIYTRDRGGLSSRSNEVAVSTKNEAPPAVNLNEASNIDTNAATLSWGESYIHDFASYRLYRDKSATVTTGSTLVVSLDDRAFTAFRDTGLETGTRYYYRVFVVDSGDDPKMSGSNTITLVTR